MSEASTSVTETGSDVPAAQDEDGLKERSRLQILFPFVSVLPVLAVGLVLMQRYRAAIDDQIFTDPFLRAGFERTNGLILMGFSFFSFAVMLLLVYGLRRSFRSFSAEVEQAGRGRFDVLPHYASEHEVSELQGQFTHLVHALNRLIHDTGIGASITVDMSGRICMINPLAQLLLDVASDKVIGQPFDQLLAGERGDSNPYVVRLLRESLETMEPLEEEQREIVLPKGRVVQVRLRTSFLASEEGGSQMVIILVARNLADITALRENVARAARFLTLGSLAARLAHEIRNPLASVAGLVEILKEEADPEDVSRLEFIAQIEKSCERLNQFLEGLMDIGSLEKCELSPVSPTEIVQETVAFKSYEVRAQGREIICECDGDLPMINAHRDWLGRALLNVVNNAVDATPEGGTITVTATRQRGSERRVGKPYIDVSIHNTGSFIPSDQREAIFDPFVTGKETGTGLGLCIVQQVLHAHNGAVILESDPDEGTRFVFRIPTL